MSLSLQQKIISSSNDIGTLQTNLNTLTVNVAEAVAFHKNIIHDDANVAELANRVTSNASNIGSLQSTTASQAGEIASITTNVANNAQAIADYNTQFVQQISAERVRAEAVESTLTTSISSEQARAEGAESVLTAGVAALDAAKQPNLIDSSEVNVKQITFHDGVNNKIVNYAGLVAIDTGFSNVNSAIASESARAVAAESVLSAAVASEASSARAAELVLTNAVSSEAATARAAESLLRTDLNFEISRASTSESQLQADLNNEISVARLNEANITTAYTAMVNTEITNRTSADNALSAAITAEAAARVAADDDAYITNLNNVIAFAWFTQTLECEGILSVNTYPFCSGMGTPQAAGFGIGIPFGYYLKGYYAQVVSNDVSRNLMLRVEHYNDGSTSSPSNLSNITLNSTGYAKISGLNNSASSGSVCLKVQTVSSALTDVNARYRVCLFFRKATAA